MWSMVHRLAAWLTSIGPDQGSAVTDAALPHLGNPPATGPIFPRDEWLNFVVDAYEGRRSPRVPPAMLPGFPPDELQIATTGQAGRPTLVEAHSFYRDCAETFERLGRPIGRDDRPLDFGTGWGRIGRFFLNEVDPDNLTGVDVDADIVEICRRTFPAGRFLVCDPFPPTELSDGSFSFVVGYSVFSHLSENTCQAWMREFHRILAPGGLVALTTRGRWFFDYCASLRAAPNPGYESALATLFPDVEATKRRYDEGEFVFATSAGVSGGGSRDASFYGETFIPEAYAARAFLPHMELVEFQFDPARQTHPILFFRRCEVAAADVAGGRVTEPRTSSH
jgi:SAM-dependent methyltransferase